LYENQYKYSALTLLVELPGRAFST